MSQLFTRDGQEFSGDVASDDKGRPVRYVPIGCDRCCVINGQRLWVMGMENNQPYSRTGFDCWTCSNTGVRGERKERLFTAKELERVNKAAATREAKRQAAAAQAAAEHAAYLDSFLAEHAEFIVKLNSLKGSDYWDSFRASFLQALKAPTTRQIEVVEGEIAKRQQNASSTFFGEVGQRMTITLTVERVITLESPFYGTTWITIGRTSEGNVVTYKGKANLGNKGDTTTVTATIKGHTTYNEIRQTEIQRPKVAEAA